MYVDICFGASESTSKSNCGTRKNYQMQNSSIKCKTLFLGLKDMVCLATVDFVAEDLRPLKLKSVVWRTD